MIKNICGILIATAFTWFAVGAIGAQDSVPAKALSSESANESSKPKTDEESKSAAAPAKTKPIELSLDLSTNAYNAAAHAKNHLMSMPSGFALVDDKPAAITKEPAYQAKPKYGAFQIGNGPRSITYFAVDEPKGERGKLYVDLNQNGDLTDDGPGDWEKAEEINGMLNYDNSLVLHASWGSAIKEDESGNFGIRIYKHHGDSRGGLMTNSARSGTLQLDGKSYPCLLVENTNDAIFTVPAVLERTRRPVELLIDLNGDGLFTGVREEVDGKTIITREVYNLSEPFKLADQWWIARPSISGKNLLIVPVAPPTTGSVVQQPIERPSLLAAGVIAPDFTAATPDGKPIKLSDFKNQIVILDFWATWCGPCKVSMPGLQAIYDNVRSQGVTVLSLNVWDEKDAFDAWITTNSGKVYNFTFAFDPAGRDKETGIPTKYGLSGIPTMYVINREGKVASAIVGSGNEAQLTKALEDQGIKVKAE